MFYRLFVNFIWEYLLKEIRLDKFNIKVLKGIGIGRKDVLFGLFSRLFL